MLDKHSKLRSLVDTGAELSVVLSFAREKQHRQIGFDFQAVKNLPIPTFSHHSVAVDLSLGRNFLLIFIV